MKNYINKNNKSIYFVSIAVIVIICGAFLSCYDNFESTIKKENEDFNIENNNNGNGGGGGNNNSGEWVKIANIATVRAGAAAAIYNDSIYLYGGEDYSGIINDFWRYNLKTEYFEKLTSGGAIAYTDMVEISGVLYIFGGKDSNGVATQNLKYCNITSGSLSAAISSATWAEIAGPSGFNGPAPSARYSHVTIAYIDPASGNRIIFVHGGFEDKGDADGTLYKLNLDDVNNSGKPTWTKLNFDVIMGEHSAAIYNDKIYFFGGYVAGTDEYLNQIYVYDIMNDSSITLNAGTPITARCAMKIITTGNGIYTYGGNDASGCFNDLWFYSFSDNNWENISTGPDKRSQYNAFYYSDCMLIYGGNYTNSSGQKIFNSELWKYPADI